MWLVIFGLVTLLGLMATRSELVRLAARGWRNATARQGVSAVTSDQALKKKHVLAITHKQRAKSQRRGGNKEKPTKSQEEQKGRVNGSTLRLLQAQGEGWGDDPQATRCYLNPAPLLGHSGPGHALPGSRARNCLSCPSGLTLFGAPDST